MFSLEFLASPKYPPFSDLLWACDFPEIFELCDYGVPEGAPAICHENAKKDDAVKSIAGSTVE
jgi:hypothetical protein